MEPVPSLRNLSYWELLDIKKRNGIVGIGNFPRVIGDNGIVGIVEAMIYTKNLIGIDHVALGSDFDGSVATPLDNNGLPLLVEEMMKQGFTNDEIRAIMGENLK